MGARKRRTFTPAYRAEAARLVIDTDRTIAAVASELSIGEQTLGRWVRDERIRSGAEGANPPLDDSERAELERLRQENQELRVDNEFLGKAAAFFASKPNPRTGSR